MYRRQNAMNLTIDPEWIVDAVAEKLKGMVPVDRHKAMIERLGEACTVKDAAHEISCSEITVRRMLTDGRLLPAVGGMRVDTRSLADLIERRQ